MTRPFRLGATSYIYPDDLTTNVRRLAPLVDDVEFVLFEVDGYGCNFPTADEVSVLARLAEDHALTYTIHLPMDVRPGDASLDKARRAIESTMALDPFAIILHFDGEGIRGNPSPATVTAWQADAEAALDAVMRWAGSPQRVCVENLEGWNPCLFDEIVAKAGASRCVDIGHLWLEGADPLPYLERHLPATRVMHLHGIGERDHSALSQLPEAQVAAVVHYLQHAGYRDLVTLEVFDAEDFFASLQMLDAVLNEVMT